jgi:tight adherence protein C
MLILSSVAIFVCAVLLAFAAIMKTSERVSARAVRARLGDYGPTVVKREEDLKQPFSGRVMVPIAQAFSRNVQRFIPSKYLEQYRHKMVLAGKNRETDLERFLILRVLSIVAIPILWLVVWKLTSLKGIDLLAIIVLIGVAGLVAPDATLNRMVADRQHEIRNKLPDVLDLLTISVEAGLGFEQALARTVTMLPGALTEEFSRALAELRAGASRADAFTALETRTDVSELRSFILALLQADTFGVSVGSILRNQAEDMRIRRRQLVQEQAQKAPVKMLFPMVFCIMPALFVVIAGPAVLSVYRIFHH